MLYIFIEGNMSKKEVHIHYCPRDDMIANFLPSHSPEIISTNIIMNCDYDGYGPVEKKECINGKVRENSWKPEPTTTEISYHNALTGSKECVRNIITLCMRNMTPKHSNCTDKLCKHPL